MANELDPKALFDQAASNTAIKNQKILDDPFNKGSEVISAKQLNADKFLTYNSKTYGKLGFDPFKDNDKLYNNKTHWSEDVERAWHGMAKLAGVGFQDTFGFGLMAGKDNWKNFEEVMQNYSSTRGGYTQFWSNTMLSSGYTMGIIGAIAAEELALAVTTAGLGNVGSSGLLATQLGKAFNKLESVGSSSRLLERVSELGHIDDAAKWYSLKSLGKTAIKGLNPVGESMDFLSNLNKMDNLNSWQKLATGAGAVARDARKMYMTHSESNLEAEMARNEFVDKKIEEAYKANGGQALSDFDVARIQKDGDNVFKSTYNGNLGLIYATNAVTFDNMFKSMRFNAKMFDLPKNVFKIGLSDAGKVTASVNKDFFKTSLKQIAKTPIVFAKKKLNEVTVGSAIKAGLSSSMEGIQELGQDVISNSVKSYYGRNHTGQQVRGGYLDYLYNDVGNAIKGVANGEGVSTFLSGFLMGGFASPVGGVISIAQNELLGGGARNKAQYLFQRQKWAQNQKTKYKEALAKAKVLSEVFDANLNYTEHASQPMFTQAELQEEILTAAQNGDKKKFEDAKHESLQTGIRTMLKNNVEGEFADMLDEMSTKYTPEQLNQALGRTDITAENLSEHQTTLANKAKDIRSYRKLYDEIEDKLVNPVKKSELDQLDITDPEQRKRKLELLIKQASFNNLKNELLFSKGKILNKAQRMEELVKVLNKDSALTTTEVQSLISASGLESEMKLLKIAVEANKNLNLTGENAEGAKETEAKLEALTAYKEAFDNLEKVQNDENATGVELEDAHNDLFEAYHNYRKVSSKEYSAGVSEDVARSKSKESFDVLADYLTLGKEHEKLQDVVNTLLDPNSAAQWLVKNQEMLTKLDKNKEEHIANQLIAYTQKAESSIMLTELQKNNLFFDLNELDDLVDKGIMPSVIYNVETGKPVSGEELKLAQQIIGSFYSRLTGKTIVGSKAAKTDKQSARAKDDKRTTKGLIRQYNLKSKMDQVIDLSDPVVFDKFMRLLESSDKLTFIEREILNIVSDSAPKIMFTESGELPISVNEDGVYVIDIRYAGADYKNAAVSFETLVLSALTQHKASESLKDNAKVRAEVETLMQQAKEAFAQSYKGAEAMQMFLDPAVFLTEALNNTAVQTFLMGVTDTTSPTKKSVWLSLISKLTMLFKKSFDQTLLQRAVDLAKITLDQETIDNIAEPAVETEDVSLSQEVGPLEELEPVLEQEDVEVDEDEVDKASKLQNEILEKTNLLNAIDAQLSTLGKLNFRKRIKLNNKRLALMDDINRLQEEYDTQYSFDDTLGADPEEAQAVVDTVETEVVRDDENKVVVTDKTPFELLPFDLQEILIKYFRQSASINELEELKGYFKKQIAQLEANFMAAQPDVNGKVNLPVKEKWDADFAKLNEDLGRNFKAKVLSGKIVIESAVRTGDPTAEEIEAIQKEMATNSEYTDLIIRYNREKEDVDVYVEPVVELDEETIRQMNATEIERAKALAQDRIQQQKEEARARRRARRASIVPLSQMERESVVELLKKVLKDDYAVLSDAEVKKLVGMLMSDSKLSPFKIPDVIAYVNEKKLKGVKIANSQLANEIADNAYEQLDIFDSMYYGNIETMLDNVANGKRMIAEYKGKEVLLKLSKTELDLLLVHHPNLFRAEDNKSLYSALYLQKKIIDSSAKGYRTSPLNTESPEALENSIIDLFLKVQKMGMLFPSTVKALNNNFIKAGSKLTIVKSKSGINGIYTLEARDRKLNAQPVTKYKSDLEVINNYFGEEQPGELFAKALIAKWFAASKNNRLNPDFITRNLVRGQGEINIKKNLLSNKSKIRTSDGFADLINQDYKELLGEDFNWVEVINDVINQYSSLKEMMAGIASEIKEATNQTDESYSEYEERAKYEAEKAEREQAESALDWANFINSGYSADYFESMAEYYNSLEYKIENGLISLKDLYNMTLTDTQQKIFDKAVEDGLYDTNDPEFANDQANDDYEDGFEAFEETLEQNKRAEANTTKRFNEVIDLGLFNSMDSFEMVARLKSLLNDSKNFDDLALFLGMYDYVNRYSIFTEKQKALLNDLMERKLNQGMYVGKSVVLNDMALQIEGYNKTDKTVDLVDLSTGELFTVPYSEFLNAQDVLLPGQEFTKLNVDTVVNDQEIDYIKTTYQDIFNNFTVSTLEFDKLDNAEIDNRILEQLTKCK